MLFLYHLLYSFRHRLRVSTYPHLTHKEIEAQREASACPRSLFKPRQPDIGPSCCLTIAILSHPDPFLISQMIPEENQGGAVSIQMGRKAPGSNEWQMPGRSLPLSGPQFAHL